MTQVKFLVKDGAICGFCLKGHSTNDADDDAGRAVCAAVSSAAYMAANTVSEVIGDEVIARVGDGEMYFEVSNPSQASQAVLAGFRLHIAELSKQYGTRLMIITEV